MDGISIDIPSVYKDSVLKGIEERLHAVSDLTGEVKTSMGSFYGLNIKFLKNRIQLRGSLIKFHSMYFDGKDCNNYCLTLKQCTEAIGVLSKKLGINPSRCSLMTLENSLTANTGIDINKLLRCNLTGYRETAPSKSSKIKTNEYREFRKGERIIKIYNKSHDEISKIRFEVRYLKSRAIPYGIRTLAHLTNPDNWYILFKDLMKKWTDILIIDDFDQVKGLSQSELNVLQNGSNPSYMARIVCKDKRYRFRNNLKEVIKTHNLSTLHQKLQKDFRDVFPTLVKTVPATLSHVDKECKSHLVKKQRRCLVTKIDISHQKSQSKFIWVKTIRNIYDSDEELFAVLLNEYCQVDKSYRSTDDIFYYIAHNVRNKYNNHQYRVERAIKRYEKSLFPFKEVEAI